MKIKIKINMTTTASEKIVCVLMALLDEYRTYTNGTQELNISSSVFNFCETDLFQLQIFFLKLKQKGVITEVISVEKKQVIKFLLPKDFKKRCEEYLAFLSPKHNEMSSLFKEVEKIQKDPEEFFKKSKDKSKEKSERKDFFYSSINYENDSERKAWEKRWNILQVIWEFFNSSGKYIEVFIPIESFITNTVSVHDIITALVGLQEEKCFRFYKKNNGVKLMLINESALILAYERTYEIYKKMTPITKRDGEETKGVNYLFDENYEKGTLCIPGYEKLKFEGRIARILYIFFKAQGQWFTRDEVRKKLWEENKEKNKEIGRAIKEINKRFIEATKREIQKVIEEKTEGERKTKKYRWGL